MSQCKIGDSCKDYSREAREGWPLPTVETEVNGDSKSTNERGPSYRLVRCTCRAGKRDYCVPWLLWSAQYKMFFSSPYTILILLSSSLSRLGRQSCWVACLLVCISGLFCIHVVLKNADEKKNAEEKKDVIYAVLMHADKQIILQQTCQKILRRHVRKDCCKQYNPVYMCQECYTLKTLDIKLIKIDHGRHVRILFTRFTRHGFLKWLCLSSIDIHTLMTRAHAVL
jgi:hypothetical protein